MKVITCLFTLFVSSSASFSQNIGIGTNNPNATLEVYDSATSSAKKTFLIRSNFQEAISHAKDTLFHISNNGNVGIGRGKASAKLNIFGDFGDSVLLELQGSPTPVFGNEAILRFSDGYSDHFDIKASFTPEAPYYNRLQIGNLLIFKDGTVVIIGGKLGVNTNQISYQSQFEVKGRNEAGTTPMTLIGVQEYSNNAAALTAGLPIGAVYRTDDLLKIVH